jgi:hypothetical protein
MMGLLVPPPAPCLLLVVVVAAVVARSLPLVVSDRRSEVATVVGIHPHLLRCLRQVAVVVMTRRPRTPVVWVV